MGFGGKGDARAPGRRMPALRAAWPWLWQWGLAAGLLVFVLPQLRSLRRPEAADLKHPAWLLIAVALEGVSTLAAVGLQRVSVAAADRPPGWRRVGIVTLAATAIGYLVPGGPAVATVYSARRYRDSGVEQETAAGGQLLLGLVIAFSIGVLGLVGVALSEPADFVDTLSTTAWSAIAWTAGALTVVSSVGLLLLRLPRTRHWLQTSRVVRWVVGAPPSSAPSRPAHAAAPAATRLIGAGLAAEALVLGGDLACLRATLAAFGVHVAIGVCVTAYALVMVVSLLPVTPGGLGVVEASLAALLVAPGTSDDVLAASVIGYRLISYWLVVVVGVVALVAERTQSGRARRHKAAAAQAGKPVKAPAPAPAAASKA